MVAFRAPFKPGGMGGGGSGGGGSSFRSLDDSLRSYFILAGSFIVDYATLVYPRSKTHRPPPTLSSDGEDKDGGKDDTETTESENEQESPNDTACVFSCVPMAPQTHFRGLETGEGMRRTRRLLIVDDARSIRSLLNRSFSKNGFEVDTAPNGKFALGMMQVSTGSARVPIVSSLY